MKNSKKFFVLSLMAMLIPFGSALRAQTASDNTMRLSSDIMSQMQIGVRGEHVKSLQAFFAADASIYPEGLITGYFGSLTRAAVMKYQAKHGISTVGRVGPQTLSMVLQGMRNTPLATFDNEDGERHVCAIVPPGHLIAPGFLRQAGGLSPIVPECQRIPPGIMTRLNIGLPITGTGPDTTAPSISSVTITAIMSNGATISWNTNERSTSQIMIGKSSNYTHQTRFDSNQATAHQQTITGLEANTTYHFQVKSIDASGNLATSGDYVFTTL